MNKLLDFGKKAVFFVRVISGYEERSIRTFRLKLQNQNSRDFLKPTDNQAELIMNMQLAGEESRMKAMKKAMQEQALMEMKRLLLLQKRS
ncbi:hypothetical protein MKX01_022315 [Papaver californicum]|nr:hypothetical protein MKX01_022315 [Papaver californicum]